MLGSLFLFHRGFHSLFVHLANVSPHRLGVLEPHGYYSVPTERIAAAGESLSLFLGESSD